MFRYVITHEIKQFNTTIPQPQLVAYSVLKSFFLIKFEINFIYLQDLLFNFKLEWYFKHRGNNLGFVQNVPFKLFETCVSIVTSLKNMTIQLVEMMRMSSFHFDDIWSIISNIFIISYKSEKQKLLVNRLSGLYTLVEFILFLHEATNIS